MMLRLCYVKLAYPSGQEPTKSIQEDEAKFPSHCANSLGQLRGTTQIRHSNGCVAGTEYYGGMAVLFYEHSVAQSDFLLTVIQNRCVRRPPTKINVQTNLSRIFNVNDFPLFQKNLQASKFQENTLFWDNIMFIMSRGVSVLVLIG